MFLLMKIQFKVAPNSSSMPREDFFNSAGFFVPRFDFQYFSVFFGGFLKFWKSFEIQDGGSKMAAVSTL